MTKSEALTSDFVYSLNKPPFLEVCRWPETGVYNLGFPLRVPKKGGDEEETPV